MKPGNNYEGSSNILISPPVTAYINQCLTFNYFTKSALSVAFVGSEMNNLKYEVGN